MKCHRSSGQGLAEFALALPVFLVIVMGLFDLGRAVVAYNTITNAAREGARLAIVNQDTAKVEQRARGIAIAAGIHQTVTTQFKSMGPNADPLTNGNCPVSPAQYVSIGCVAVVTYTSQFQAVTPIVGALVGPFTMTARSMLTVEYTCPSTSTPNSDNCARQP
jgi:Flp pilus assembly protein TadG